MLANKTCLSVAILQETIFESSFLRSIMLSLILFEWKIAFTQHLTGHLFNYLTDLGLCSCSCLSLVLLLRKSTLEFSSLTKKVRDFKMEHPSWEKKSQIILQLLFLVPFSSLFELHKCLYSQI